MKPNEFIMILIMTAMQELEVMIWCSDGEDPIGEAIPYTFDLCPDLLDATPIHQMLTYSFDVHHMINHRFLQQG